METHLPMRRKARKAAAYVVAVILLLGCAVFLLLCNVNQQGIISHDEGRHGVNAYEMMKNNDYIVHTNRWEPDFWNLKPPLSFWGIQLGFVLFGFDYLGFRFQCIFAVMLLFLFVAWWADKRKGALASVFALVFLIANPIFFERTSDADELYWLLSAIGLLCMLDSERDIRRLYGTALCFGFAFLAKSYHALMIPMICFAYLCLTGRLRALKAKHYVLLIVFGLLPIAPWAVARYLRDGTEFFVKMVQTDVVQRVGDDGPVVGSQQWCYYLVTLVSNPAVMIAGAVSLAALIHKLAKGGKITKLQIGLLVWMILPVLVFSVPKFKLEHYVQMIMPAIAISGAISAAYWVKRLRGHRLFVPLALVLAAGLIWQISDNVQLAFEKSYKGSYQTAIGEMFDRDSDSGVHVYIQKREVTEWQQNDMLCAMMAGDVLCLDGGIEAFQNDEEAAVVIVDNTWLNNDLMEHYPVFYETSYVTALSN